MRKATDQRDAQTISLLWTSLLLFHGGDVTCFDACHVIWCGGHVIWCDVIACVVSCHVMQCDVMWCALMWCALQWSRCVFEVVLWQCGDPKYYSVLQSTTVYYKVLLQYYSVLQSTTPVLLCTTQYYSVLLQYYSVLQSTTPVLLCTTKYYSSTTLYYNVLLQYYSVLQSTTPVLLCTSKQHSWLILDTYEPLFTWLMSVAYETSFTMRGVAGVILQLHQILHLPRKMTVMIDPRHIWNVIYNARSNRSHNPTSPNTAPATQNESHDWSESHMKRHLQCAEQPESHSNFSKYCACHAKCISWLIRVTYETSFRMRGASKVNLEPQQILRLPRKMNLMIDPRLIWNVISIAQSKQSQPPTSANTAPATQNESHDWSASHMKRHFQCTEQAMSPSNLTKYCACHEIFKFKIAAETLWIASANRKTIRG